MIVLIGLRADGARKKAGSMRLVVDIESHLLFSIHGKKILIVIIPAVLFHEYHIFDGGDIL